LVGGARRRSGEPPMRDEIFALKGPDGDLGITNVEHHDHGNSSSTREPDRYGVTESASATSSSPVAEMPATLPSAGCTHVLPRARSRALNSSISSGRSGPCARSRSWQD